MVRKGKDLEFISKITGDGLSLIPVSEEIKNNDFHLDSVFQVNCLSITNGLYIASGSSSYIVKLKDDVEELICLTEEHHKIMREYDVLVSVYTNASGFLWQIMKVSSGTSLGWSEFTGDCKISGTFTSYNKAMKDAIDLVKLANLKKFQNASKSNFHWGNYAGYLQSLRKMNEVLDKSKGAKNG